MQLSRSACASDRHSHAPQSNNSICPRSALNYSFLHSNSLQPSFRSSPARRTGRCFGILDSYRKDQAAKQKKAEELEQLQEQDVNGVQMLVYDSVDEDTCPAECVMEIYSAEEFKTICQV